MDFSSGHLLFGLISIVLVNLVLSGDNAVVIALAVRSLPPGERTRALFAGAACAVLLQGRSCQSLLLFFRENGHHERLYVGAAWRDRDHVDVEIRIRWGCAGRITARRQNQKAQYHCCFHALFAPPEIPDFSGSKRRATARGNFPERKQELPGPPSFYAIRSLAIA